jgi:putative tricarboxylic transport membrane protein
MNKRDLISGVFWMIFGAVFAIGGLKQGLVKHGIPGPGSFPFIVGLICVGLSLVVFIVAFRQRPLSFENFFPHESSLLKLILALASILGYGFLLKPLGFVLTTFIFMLFSLHLIGQEKWLTTLVFSLLVAVLSFILFTALQVELPKGILGI